MARPLLLLALVAAGLLLVAAVRRLRREAGALRAARAGCLDAAAPLLADPGRVIDPSGFPRIAGRLDGRPVEVRAMPDALTFRKLPALWLLATLNEPQPLRAETRIMRRPSGFEPFSTFATLSAETPLPPGFPEGVVLRTEDPSALPPYSFLAGLARRFEDPTLKEVVLSPNGLRLVRLVEEAPRSRYLLYRDSDLGHTAVPAPTLSATLAALLSLAGDLAAAAGSVGRRA